MTTYQTTFDVVFFSLNPANFASVFRRTDAALHMNHPEYFISDCFESVVKDAEVIPNRL